MATLYIIPMVMKNEAYLVTNRYVLFSFSGRCFLWPSLWVYPYSPSDGLIIPYLSIYVNKNLTILGKIINNIV